ncbi:MAG: DUF6457 domain-containing protein [Acidimicrobiales bacterium]
MTGREFVAAFAAALGTHDLTDEQAKTLLQLASVAAHGSERIAAPLVCYVAGHAGIDVAEALAAAEQLLAE